MRRSLFIAMLAAAVAGGLSRPAAADQQGAPGRLVAFRLTLPASADYNVMRGRIELDVGGTLETYHWGRAFCPGKDLTEHEEAVLRTALGDKRRVVVPFYLNGQAGTRCLVQFLLTDRKTARKLGMP